ncbi:MAG: LUD domain-containing protein, partial [Anaerolineales bacterium]|nr:LUD domain-containing protein [Anaerolineales bacterium]
AEQHIEIPESQVMIDSNSPTEPIKKDQGDLRAEFKLELEALGGEFISCSESDLSQKVLNCLHQAGVTTIQSWGADQFLETLLPELEKAGINITHEPDPEIKAGLTAARAAVAETGSLIISTGPGRPLTASLLPDVHLAILKEEDILPDLTHALSLEEIREASSTVIISGPSRTADIEMTLTIGVHGPGQLYVFCLEQ